MGYQFRIHVKVYMQNEERENPSKSNVPSSLLSRYAVPAGVEAGSGWYRACGDHQWPSYSSVSLFQSLLFIVRKYTLSSTHLLSGPACDGALELQKGAADAVAHGGLAVRCDSDRQRRRLLGPAVAVAKEPAARRAGSAGCAGLAVGRAGRACTAAEEAGAGAAPCCRGGTCRATEAEAMAMVMVARPSCAGVGRQKAAAGGACLFLRVEMHFCG